MAEASGVSASPSPAMAHHGMAKARGFATYEAGNLALDYIDTYSGAGSQKGTNSIARTLGNIAGVVGSFYTTLGYRYV